MRTMEKQDRIELDELQQSEAKEKDLKRKKGLISKQKANLSKQLAQLNDPNAMDNIEKLEAEKRI